MTADPDTARPPKRRTAAHTAAQLADALGLSPGQFARARAAGLIDEPDMKTPRWSGPVVDDLVARRDTLAAEIPDDLDSEQLRHALGLDYGQWRRGRDAGVIPGPDRGGYWTRPLADTLTGRAAHLRQAIPPAPLGAARCADLLAEATSLPVDACDIEQAAARGLIAVVDSYKDRPLYDVAALRALAQTSHPRHHELVGLVTGRQAWLAGSLTPGDAAAVLGWHERDLEPALARHGVRPGRFGRYDRAVIDALARDEELIEQVRRERLLGPDQAADHAQIRRRDFDYCTAAGWIRPATYVEREAGRRTVVRVPLYTVGDIEDMLTIGGVDWEAVRAVKPGETSPLRDHARLPIARADAVRAFCAELSATFSVEVWPHYNVRRGRWEIDWELSADGHPTLDQVRAALTRHRGARRHTDAITLSTAVGEVIAWARDCLEPGRAVVVDTETTGLGDGDVVVEIAVVDAATGAVLLDTLVHPGGVAVDEGARRVHGISDADLAAAPAWAQVAPSFAQAVAGRTVLAYNAAFDRARIAATHARAGLDAGMLPPADRWGCLLQARSVWARVGYLLPLGGGHRACGDALEARRVLQAMAAPAGAAR